MLCMLCFPHWVKLQYHPKTWWWIDPSIVGRIDWSNPWTLGHSSTWITWSKAQSVYIRHKNPSKIHHLLKFEFGETPCVGQSWKIDRPTLSSDPIDRWFLRLENYSSSSICSTHNNWFTINFKLIYKFILTKNCIN